MIAEKTVNALPPLRLHSDLPDSLSRARTPLEVLTALAREGANHDFDLWAMAARRDGAPVVYLCSAAPLAPEVAASQLAHFIRSANVMAEAEEWSNWEGAEVQALCVQPQAAPVGHDLAEYRDLPLRLAREDGVVIRAASLKGEGERHPAWSRLDMMLHFAAPYLRAVDLNNTDTARGMTDVESGTYSWPYFLDALEREVERARRDQCDLALAVLELRPLKSVEALMPPVHRCVGEHVERVVRRTDLVGRIGPAAYAIFFHGTGPRPALIAAGRIADALRQDETLMKTLSFSLGVSGWEGEGLLETSTLLAQATEAANEAAVIAPDRAFVYL